MDSLDDILNRVLQNSAEKVAQRIEPVMNRRPLKDPQTNAAGFFQDISTAVRNIRSPEVAGALQSQAMQPQSVQAAGARYASPEEREEFLNGGGFGPSSPADQRRTTIADDASVIGQITNSATQIVRQIATAGKAIGEFSGSAGNLDRAVSGMAQTVVAADKDVKASMPAESLTGWLKSLTGRGTQAGSESSGSGTATAGSGGVSSWSDSFPFFSFARRFGGKSADSTNSADSASSQSDSSSAERSAGSGSQPAKTQQDRKESWLESSSIADSVRGFFGRFRPSLSPAQMSGTNPAANGGSVPLAQQDPSSGNGQGLFSRLSQSFDKALANSSTMFRAMGRQSSPADGAGGGSDNGNQNESWLESSSIADSVRGFTRKTVSRLGRRALSSPALRRRFINGRRLLRGGGAGVTGGGGSAGTGGTGGAGGAGGVFRGGLGWMIPPGGAGAGGAGAAAGGAGGFGGGAAAGAGGAGAGGAGGAGAAGGAAVGGGMLTAGLILGFVGLIAVTATVVSALHKLGMQGYETALRVSQFDGTLAAAKAQLDVSRMLRDVQTARSLSESGAGFMKALDKLEAAMRPITDGALDLGLRALTEIVLLLTDALQLLTKAVVMHLKITDVLLFGAIPNDLIQRIDDAVNRPAAPPNIGQRGFFDGQMQDRPFRQPRPPLPPMGGGNGN